MGIAPALAAMTVAAMMARLGIFIAVMCQQSCFFFNGVKYLVDLVLKIIFGRPSRQYYMCFKYKLHSCKNRKKAI
jgi:hypothetical protein